MLVDNGVVGDSRVQKQAESAAAAGWDVLLIGRSLPRSPRSKWRIGEAQVRLVDLPPDFGRRRMQWRRAPLRAPLAYPTEQLANHRRQINRSRLADRRHAIDVARVGGGARLVTVPFLRAAVLARKVQGRWITLRTTELDRIDRLRENASGRIDRFWTEVHRRRGDWRRLDPSIMKWELAYAPAVDRFDPDIIHANDFRVLPVAVRAKARAAARGRDVRVVWDAHEYLPGMVPWDPHPRWLLAHRLLEQQHASGADAVTTVAEPIADLLRADHHLPVRPTVVANAPVVDAAADPDQPDVRTSLGLPDEVPLLVYAGGVAHQRGTETVVDALALLPGVHVVLVVGSTSPYLKSLRKRAGDLGVSDRLHVHPYVDPSQITRFLSTASVGLIPFHRWPNHDLSLPTKYYEYSHARLPIVTSDVDTVAEAVRATGQGEVFVAGDVAGLARAVSTVLADDTGAYRRAYDDPALMETLAWPHHAARLMAVYDSLHPGPPR